MESAESVSADYTKKSMRKLHGEEWDEEPGEDARGGDYYLGHLNRCRGMMLAPELWPAALRDFAVKLNRYKTSRGVSDFCDLIETARRDIRIAPTRPEVIFADEAQDLNPMQLALVRSWGENAQYFMLAADDDQTIYSWCGATPEAVLSPEIPEDHKIVLKESHPVPRRCTWMAIWRARTRSPGHTRKGDVLSPHIHPAAVGHTAPERDPAASRGRLAAYHLRFLVDDARHPSNDDADLQPRRRSWAVGGRKTQPIQQG
jgi:hypothetical protein